MKCGKRHWPDWRLPKILHACEEPARPRRDVYTKLDEVTAQRNAARATEKAAKAQYDMAKNGAEREDKALPLPWWNAPKELWPKLNRTSRKLT